MRAHVEKARGALRRASAALYKSREEAAAALEELAAALAAIDAECARDEAREEAQARLHSERADGNSEAWTGILDGNPVAQEQADDD